MRVLTGQAISCTEIGDALAQRTFLPLEPLEVAPAVSEVG